jgi:hypothetical protein
VRKVSEPIIDDTSHRSVPPEYTPTPPLTATDWPIFSNPGIGGFDLQAEEGVKKKEKRDT